MQGWELDDYQEQNKVLLKQAGVIDKKQETLPTREIRERPSSQERSRVTKRSQSREKDHDRWFHDKFTYEEDRKESSDQYKNRQELPQKEAYGRGGRSYKSRADRERW